MIEIEGIGIDIEGIVIEIGSGNIHEKPGYRHDGIFVIVRLG